MRKTISQILLLLFAAMSARAASLPVIPCPAHVEQKSGEYDASRGYDISVADSSFVQDAIFLCERLNELGLPSKVYVGSHSAAPVVIRKDSKIDDREGYTLNVSRKKISIAAADAAGVFYAGQTLLQLLENSAALPCVDIADAPRYAWRGFMRDDSRHFTGTESVKQFIDLMARYKLNRFHWHLTDAQGWRIEIKKYPLLTEIGAIGSHSDPYAPRACYTQDEIRDIVDYAARRHVMIIPEIDMPGHAAAANRAYPEFNGGGEGIFPDFTFNPGKEGTYQYLSDILTEVADLFPGPYMHIGGDEVAYGINAWKTDPDVLALMEREGFTDVRQCERYFMNRMITQIASLGKTLIGWDELIDLNVDPSTNIMWWRHDKPGYLTRSLDAGYTTVMCPRKPLYFDFVQHDTHTVGRIWDGFCPLDSVYAFPEPLFEAMALTPEQKSHISGMQANAWSELLHTPQRVDFMTWPRLCALAESSWTLPENKDYADFEKRLNHSYDLLDRLGIYYFDHRAPERTPEPAGPVIKKKTRESETNYRD
ncbi:MAG: beta-N-acetylhexosaminidase [Muribaculaceae bacterium]|nr:beta-N-acetylhexosaminidase [Muribaculaceae bacterium]